MKVRLKLVEEMGIVSVAQAARRPREFVAEDLKQEDMPMCQTARFQAAVFYLSPPEGILRCNIEPSN